MGASAQIQYYQSQNCTMPVPGSAPLQQQQAWKASHAAAAGNILDAASACFDKLQQQQQAKGNQAHGAAAAAMMQQLLQAAAEPTSVLDLQTSPGRSCSSLSSCHDVDSSFDPSAVAAAAAAAPPLLLQIINSQGAAASSCDEQAHLYAAAAAAGGGAGAGESEQLFLSSWIMDCMPDDALHDAEGAPDLELADLEAEEECDEVGVTELYSSAAGPRATSQLKLQRPNIIAAAPAAPTSCVVDMDFVHIGAGRNYQLQYCRPSEQDYCNYSFPGITSSLQVCEQQQQQQAADILMLHDSACEPSSSTDDAQQLDHDAAEIQFFCNPASHLVCCRDHDVDDRQPESIYDDLGASSSQLEYYNALQKISIPAAAISSSSAHYYSSRDGSSAPLTAAPSTHDLHEHVAGGEIPRQLLQLQPDQDMTSCSSSSASGTGLQLVHLLLGCAEAIDAYEYQRAGDLLAHLRAISSPQGDPMQRIAFYFAQALSDRLAHQLLHNNNNRSSCSCHVAAAACSSMMMMRRPAALDHVPHQQQQEQLDHESTELLAYQAFYEVLPFAKFAHFTGNEAILEAVGSSSRVHVVDLEIGQGLQWPAFFQSLVLRPGGPPHLRITALGSSSSSSCTAASYSSAAAAAARNCCSSSSSASAYNINYSSLQQTGRRLAQFASTLHLPFEYDSVPLEKIQDFHPGLIRLCSDEALVVNCSHVLHRLLAMEQQQQPHVDHESTTTTTTGSSSSSISPPPPPSSPSSSAPSSSAPSSSSASSSAPSSSLPSSLPPRSSSSPAPSSSSLPPRSASSSSLPPRSSSPSAPPSSLPPRSSSSSSSSALEKMLLMIRSMRPTVVCLLEVEANYHHHHQHFNNNSSYNNNYNNSSSNSNNISSFMSSFVEALHYFCALFDALEATLPRESGERKQIENTTFASQIKDIVAAGDQLGRRRIHYMRSHSWQYYFHNAGFRLLLPSSYAIQQAHLLLALYCNKQQQQQLQHGGSSWSSSSSCNNNNNNNNFALMCNAPVAAAASSYKLIAQDVDSAVLTLGWHDTPIIAVSSWTVNC